MPILAGLAAIIIIGGLVLLSLISKNMAPSQKRFELETQRMKEDMEKWIGPLVPINNKELELFSLGQDKQVLRKGITTTAKGIFTTIYQEPILAYSYREYLSKAGKPNALLYARTAEHEYIYWIQKGVATLFIDDQEVGTLSVDGVLKGKRTGKEIASLRKSTTAISPVVIGSKEVGNLSNKPLPKEKELNERAFEYLLPNLNSKEEQLFLALITEELVNRIVHPTDK